MLIPTCQNTCLVALGQGWRAIISGTVREQPTISTACKATHCKTPQLALLPSTFRNWLLPKVRMEYLRYLTFHLIFSSSYSYAPIPFATESSRYVPHFTRPRNNFIENKDAECKQMEKNRHLFLPIINLLSVSRRESRHHVSNKFDWCSIFKTIIQFFNIHR